MSHFTVTTIGNVDEQLAPFHEFECTGQNDEFVLDLDKTKEYHDDYMKEDRKETFLQFLDDYYT